MALTGVFEVGKKSIGWPLGDSVLDVVLVGLESDTSMDAFSRLDNHFLSACHGHSA